MALIFTAIKIEDFKSEKGVLISLTPCTLIDSREGWYCRIDYAKEISELVDDMDIITIKQVVKESIGT